MQNKWVLLSLSLLALLVGIAYILAAHPPIVGAVMVVLIAVTLCGASWVVGG